MDARSHIKRITRHSKHRRRCRSFPSSTVHHRMTDRPPLLARPIIAVGAIVMLALTALIPMLTISTANAASGTITVTSVPSNPYYPGGDGHFFRVSGSASSVAYCAQGWLRTPNVDQELDRYGTLDIPELDYVMYHGYDGEVVTSLYGLDKKRSEAATAAAIWLAIADQRGDVLDYETASGGSFHGNQMYLERWQLIEDKDTKDAAWRLYQEGLAYKKKGGGGDEEGCAILWVNKTKGTAGTFDYQCLVTAEKRITVRFTKVSAEVSTTAGNESYSYADASYDIYRADDDSKVASISTDEQGRASLTLAPNTDYYAIETKAPAGFVKSEKKVEFSTGSAPSEVKLTDTPGTFKLVVSKRDAATGGAAQVGASLAGAEFHLVSDATAGFELTGTTDEQGMLTFENIPLGDIRVIETKAPEGYLLDETVHSYSVSAEDLDGKASITLTPEADFLEVPVACDVEIAKFLDDGDDDGSGHRTPAVGVEFEIISNSTGDVVGSIITGDDGYASTEGEWFGSGNRPEASHGALPYDREGYTVRENPKTTPDGFKPLDEWSISATQLVDGATLRYIVDNQVIATRLQIVKRDAGTGERVPLAGFSFEILDENGQPISQNAWYPNHVDTAVFTTDESGAVTLPELLRAGTYRIREINCPSPYLVNSEETSFTVDEATDTPLVVIDVNDARATGSASLVKTCEDDGERLAGAEYDVIARQDIVGLSGTVEVLAGTVLGHAETDEDGIASIEGLPLGCDETSYAFIETKAPEGHVLDTTPIEFMLTWQDEDTAVVSTELEATNAPNRIELHKSALGIEGHAVSGAQFALWRVDQEAEGSQIAPGTPPKLQEGHEPQIFETGEDGVIAIDHLASGTYRMIETAAPAGYLINSDLIEFTVSERGTIDGSSTATIEMEDDFTKIEVSKRDITDEEELEGAHLSVLDADGNTIDSWVSESTPHLITFLAPGTYRLVETFEPRTHDKAAEIEFTVEETGEVQPVVMYDEPIRITGEVDKRQEIADPVASDTEENGDGNNRAEVTRSDKGRFSYLIDMRNTSTTWVDEFTMTDEIDGADKGLVELTGITTPQAHGDFDGLMNVWYRTSSSSDRIEDSSANATIDDGHENPWLSDESTVSTLGSDGRALDYTGWHLWRADIPTEQATKLSIDELDLAKDEVVTAIRFEYGRVEAGFSTRNDLWERSDLKDEHDDVHEPPLIYRDEAFTTEDGTNAFRAPAILHMRATDTYRDGTELTNRTSLDLYRNGGGDNLEDHDEDEVVQVPRTTIRFLDQTGITALGSAGLVVGLIAAIIGIARSVLRTIR